MMMMVMLMMMVTMMMMMIMEGVTCRKALKILALPGLLKTEARKCNLQHFDNKMLK